MRQLVGLFVMVLASGAAQAQVYKCIDANGKTVYSQSPCPKTSRSTTLERSAPAPSPAKEEAGKSLRPKTVAEQEREFRKRRQDQEEVGKKDEQKLAQAKEREENCRNARMQLITLDSGTRQMRFDEKGERYYLDDEQIAREKERAQRAVESWCK
jgi:hypothetical protein